MFWGNSAPPAPVVYDELPTPLTNEDFKEVAKKALEESLALENDPRWNQLKYSNPSVRLYELNDPDSPLKSVKITTELPASPTELYHFVTDDRMDQRRLWDKELLEIRVIKKVEDIDVIYQAYKAPYPVTNRNFVAIRGHTTLDDGTEVSYGQSINYDEILSSNDFVRGTALSAVIIHPIPGKKYKCVCTRVVRLDPKGSIPTMVVNKGISKTGDAAVQLRKVIKELSKTWIRKEEEKNIEVVPSTPDLAEEEEDKENYVPVLNRGLDGEESEDFQFWDTSHHFAESSFHQIEEIMKPLKESVSTAERKITLTSDSLLSTLQSIEAKQTEILRLMKHNDTHSGITIQYSTLFLVVTPIVAYTTYKLFNLMKK